MVAGSTVPVRRSAVTRLLMFASGTKAEVLDRAGIDGGAQLTLGATVLLTSVIAACSIVGAAAVAFGDSWWHYLPVGLLYGVVILSFDRFLVSVQLNPFRFRTAAGAKDGPTYGRTRRGRSCGPSPGHCRAS